MAFGLSQSNDFSWKSINSSDFLSLFQPKCSYAVSMATGMHMDERSVDCLIFGQYDQDRKVSAKSVTMRAMTLCKNLSGYRELLIIDSIGPSIILRSTIFPHDPFYEGIFSHVSVSVHCIFPKNAFI